MASPSAPGRRGHSRSNSGPTLHTSASAPAKSRSIFPLTRIISLDHHPSSNSYYQSSKDKLAKPGFMSNSSGSGIGGSSPSSSRDVRDSTAVGTSSRVNATASRILSSMRKSLSPPPKRRQVDSSKMGMYSTPEESSYNHAYSNRINDASSARPTVEQIAMGLHVSRTPHLRPVAKSRHTSPGLPNSLHHKNSSGAPSSHPYPSHLVGRHSYDTQSPWSRSSSPMSAPPAPSRSSLKKPKSSIDTTDTTDTSVTTPVLSLTSHSTATITSTTPSTPPSSNLHLGLRAKMSRFLPGHKGTPSASRSDSGGKGAQVELGSPKKAVRFSTSVLALNEGEAS